MFLGFTVLSVRTCVLFVTILHNFIHIVLETKVKLHLFSEKKFTTQKKLVDGIKYNFL
jgi:hypothetical protein